MMRHYILSSRDPVDRILSLVTSSRFRWSTILVVLEGPEFLNLKYTRQNGCDTGRRHRDFVVNTDTPIYAANADDLRGHRMGTWVVVDDWSDIHIFSSKYTSLIIAPLCAKYVNMFSESNPLAIVVFTDPKLSLYKYNLITDADHVEQRASGIPRIVGEGWCTMKRSLNCYVNRRLDHNPVFHLETREEKALTYPLERLAVIYDKCGRRYIHEILAANPTISANRRSPSTDLTDVMAALRIQEGGLFQPDASMRLLEKLIMKDCPIRHPYLVTRRVRAIINIIRRNILYNNTGSVIVVPDLPAVCEFVRLIEYELFVIGQNTHNVLIVETLTRWDGRTLIIEEQTLRSLTPEDSSFIRNRVRRIDDFTRRAIANSDHVSLLRSLFPSSVKCNIHVYLGNDIVDEEFRKLYGG